MISSHSPSLVGPKAFLPWEGQCLLGADTPNFPELCSYKAKTCIPFASVSQHRHSYCRDSSLSVQYFCSFILSKGLSREHSDSGEQHSYHHRPTQPSNLGCLKRLFHFAISCQKASVSLFQVIFLPRCLLSSANCTLCVLPPGHALAAPLPGLLFPGPGSLLLPEFFSLLHFWAVTLGN